MDCEQYLHRQGIRREPWGMEGPVVWYEGTWVIEAGRRDHGGGDVEGTGVALSSATGVDGHAESDDDVGSESGSFPGWETGASPWRSQDGWESCS